MNHTTKTSFEARSSGFFFALHEWLSVRGLLLTPRQWIAHIAAVEQDFWARAKTRTVQFMAGAASFIWGVSLFFEPQSFQSQAYSVMRDQMPARYWSLLFVGHTVFVLMSRWCPIELPRFQWAVSFYGFAIWSYYVLATWRSLEHFAVGTSFEIVAVFMLAWSLRRAGRDLKLGGRNAIRQ